MDFKKIKKDYKNSFTILEEFLWDKFRMNIKNNSLYCKKIEFNNIIMYFGLIQQFFRDNDIFISVFYINCDNFLEDGDWFNFVINYTLNNEKLEYNWTDKNNMFAEEQYEECLKQSILKAFNLLEKIIKTRKKI